VKKVPLLIFSNVTRNGILSLTFNQKIMVPSFIQSAEGPTRRELLAIDTIDVSQIISLRFVLKSNIHPDEIKYSLELQKWNDQTI